MQPQAGQRWKYEDKFDNVGIEAVVEIVDEEYGKIVQTNNPKGEFKLDEIFWLGKFTLKDKFKETGENDIWRRFWTYLSGQECPAVG